MDGQDYNLYLQFSFLLLADRGTINFELEQEAQMSQWLLVRHDISHFTLTRVVISCDRMRAIH